VLKDTSVAGRNRDAAFEDADRDQGMTSSGAKHDARRAALPVAIAGQRRRGR
jgi:hypothetical protein